LALLLALLHELASDAWLEASLSFRLYTLPAPPMPQWPM
jgi:hypothetical protein